MTVHAPISTNQIGAQQAAEATLISAVLRNRPILEHLGQVVAAQFVDPVHKAAWSALLSDPLITEIMGLRITVPSMTDDQASRITMAHQADQIVLRARDYIVNGYRRRTTKGILLRALEEIDDLDTAVDTVVGKLTRDASALAATSSRAQSGASVARDLFKGGNSAPIPTGIPPLDYVLHGGLRRGSMTAGFARFKQGKTLLAATIGTNLERRKVKVLTVSLERKKGDAERFAMARALNVDAQDLDLENKTFLQAYDEYLDENNRSLSYLHQTGITSDELRAEIVADKFARDTDVVIIDYWQLINFTGRESREERMSISAQMLADLAVQLDVAILVFGQLNDEGKPKYAEAVLGACGIAFRFTRLTDMNPNAPDEGADCFIEGMICNCGPVRTKGSQKYPSMELVQPGPHFREYRAL